MPPPMPPSPAAPPFAGFGSRLGAFIIDAIIVALMIAPAVIVLFAGPKEIGTCRVDAAGEISFDDGPDNAFCEEPTSGTLMAAIGFGVIGFVGGLLCQVVLNGRGQTVGKRALGIKVVDASSGAPIGAGRATGRFFMSYVSTWVCYLGYLWVLWDKEKQTWHDKVVNAYVVVA